MSQFFQYSLESAICLAVMLLPYLLWFRKMTFYQWNRFYLLGAIFFSLSAPLVNLEIKAAATPEIVKLKEDFRLFDETPNNLPIIKTENIPFRTDDITAYKQPEIDVFTSESTSTPWEIQDVLLSIYLLGFSGFLGMFLHRLAKLFKLIARGNKTQKQGFTSIHLQGKQVFSFFHFVFFDHNRYNENERQTLLKHEKVHIQQRHSLDLLFSEILQVVFWFNPMYICYKKLLQQEHEYFVDVITSKDIGKSQYAQMLLSLATPRPPLVGHAFAYIPVKHRIFKLFQKPSTAMEKSKFLIVLPFLMILFLLISCSFDELEEISVNSKSVGKHVRSVQAYFADELSVVKQEKDVGGIQFNRDGTIAELDINEHPIFGSSIPNNFRKGFLWEYNAALFEGLEKKSGILNDFFSKRAQWILAGDPKIHAPELATILFYENGKIWLNTEKYILRHSMNFDIYGITNNSNEMSLKGKKSDNVKVSWVQRNVKFDDNGQILSANYQKKIKSKIFSYNTGNTLMDSILNSLNQRRTVESERKTKFEMQYSNFGKLEGIYPFESSRSKLTDGDIFDVELHPKDFMRFTHDEKGNIYEIHLIKDENNAVLRKYRFHYNEAGYCIKKECINREGNVEFSVRFEYEFYPN